MYDSTQSQTAHMLDELALYGVRPGSAERDYRPLPKADRIEQSLAAAFEAIIDTMADTRLEEDLDETLWGLTNIFHRRLGYLDGQLDRNEQAQRQAVSEQDGSEVKSVELERLIGQGQSLLKRRNAAELMRDASAVQYEAQSGTPWLPRTSSMTSHRNLTAAVIDSREFANARERKADATLCSEGTKIVSTGGQDYSDHETIWKVLDRTKAKHPNMVLLHGGLPKGAELITARWARPREVPAVVFKPDFTRDGRSAPFKRNDRMLAEMPAGVFAFPGNRINAN